MTITELRWVVPDTTTTEKRLQMRVRGDWPLKTGPWVDVPTEVLQMIAPPETGRAVCPQCGVDRAEEPCPQNTSPCPITGTAQGSNALPVSGEHD